MPLDYQSEKFLKMFRDTQLQLKSLKRQVTSLSRPPSIAQPSYNSASSSGGGGDSSDFANAEYLETSFHLIEDKDSTAPPGSPTNGDKYIPAATATGDWTGYEGYIALYDNTGTWVFLEPTEGMTVYVLDENTWYVYNGSAWVKAETLLDHDNLLNFASNEHFTEASIDHGNISNVTTSQHHTRYADSEAVDALEAVSGEVLASGDSMLFIDVTDGVMKKELVSDIDETMLTGIKAYVDVNTMIGSANKKYVPMQWAGANNYSNWVAPIDSATRIHYETKGADDYVVFFQLSMPNTLGSLNLFVDAISVEIFQADADDYLDLLTCYQMDYNSTNSLVSDTTNRTAANVYEYTFTATSMSGYTNLMASLAVVATSGGQFRLTSVSARCYYA